MTGCVFLGPTLDAATARALAPVTVRPPAAVGDVHRAVLDGFTTVLLVDGCFHSVPSVQHKEIVFGLSRGVRVLGCSSMGALRAAELHRYGMVGVGAIFRAYRDGVYTADDEVAVAHADERYGFRALSTPMVTVRHGLAEAYRAGVVSGHTVDVLIQAGKAIFYADRHWSTVIERGRALGLPEAELSALAEFVRATRPDPKREDAVEALRLVASGHRDLVATEQVGPAAPPVAFEPTYAWSVLLADESAVPEPPGP